jgi:hypothetical protein
MNKADGKLRMAKLARIDHDSAELDGQMAELASRRAQLGAQRAAIWAEMAEGEVVDLRTLQKPKTPHRPTIAPPSEVDRARARALLRDGDLRRTRG